ncbi:hypothetical protein ABFS82_03G014600 [Erythranthe guttata]
MSTAYLTEAYMIRKLHNEKMNKINRGSKKLKSSSGREKAESYCESCRSSAASASGGGCFSLFMFKKIHPNTASSSDS